MREIELAAKQRGQALREESRSVEERPQKALLALRRMTMQLEELLGTSTRGAESLTDALKPAAREGESRPTLVPSPSDADQS